MPRWIEKAWKPFFFNWFLMHEMLWPNGGRLTIEIKTIEELQKLARPMSVNTALPRSSFKSVIPEPA